MSWLLRPFRWLYWLFHRRERELHEHNVICAWYEFGAAASDLGADELLVLTAIAKRLQLGMKQYGALNIAADTRDWTKEANEEALDMSVYLAIKTLKQGGEP